MLKSNTGALAFYERLGGINFETVVGNDIGDQEVIKSREAWDSLKELVRL
ncbi:hypothetical protein [Arenibacter troitsensis]|nr:hypothetical protein [Arenibacter troitsensis]